MDRVAEPFLTERFAEALAYATEVHATQLRKGTDIPYVAHLLGVCSLVLEDGGTEDEAVAALLHDAAEDHGGQETLDEIDRKFGPDVAEIVEGLSDTLETPKPPWRPRKEAYLAHLEDASPGELRVSLADKLHNARAILYDFRAHGDSVWTRFGGRREGTIWYHGELARAFMKLYPGPLAEEYRRTVEQLRKAASGRLR